MELERTRGRPKAGKVHAKNRKRTKKSGNRKAVFQHSIRVFQEGGRFRIEKIVKTARKSLELTKLTTTKKIEKSNGMNRPGGQKDAIGW